MYVIHAYISKTVTTVLLSSNLGSCERYGRSSKVSLNGAKWFKIYPPAPTPNKFCEWGKWFEIYPLAPTPNSFLDPLLVAS